MSRHICLVENSRSPIRGVTKRIAGVIGRLISLLESRVYCGCNWAMPQAAVRRETFLLVRSVLCGYRGVLFVLAPTRCLSRFKFG